MEEYAEYRASVFDREQGCYEQLFVTQHTPLLAKNRAIERAVEFNRYWNRNFDTQKVLVEKRTVRITREKWRKCNEN